jgi:predicted porin
MDQRAINLSELMMCINLSRFSIGTKGYLATGGQTTGVECWEYNPGTDVWIEKTSFEGTIRSDAVGFTIGNRGYVVTGRSGSFYFDDIWALDPDATYVANE